MSEKKRLYKLEAVRGFAAVYVLCYHLFASGISFFGFDFSFLFRFGQEAVILFFLLSGFVIYYAQEKSNNQSSFKIFFWKRFLRIFIPLIIVFVTNYLLISYQNHKLVKIDIANLIGNLLMLQDNADKKPNVICEPFLGNEPLWSLSYEWWFYLLFFIIAKVKFVKNKDYFVFSLAVISSITYLIYPFFINRELTYLAIWWSGLYLAKLYISSVRVTYRSLLLPFCSLGLITLVLSANFLIIDKNTFSKAGALSAFPILEFRHFLFSLVILFVLPLWTKFNWFGFDVLLGRFKYVASFSFVIYISHWFLVYDARYLDFIVNKDLRLASYIAICFLFSYIVELKIYPFIYKYCKQLINF